jgi:uncharacterized membrane-anchored protein
MKNLPKLNASYWFLMLLCTTMGELIGNLLSRNFELGYTKGAIIDICIFSVTILAFLLFKLKNEIFYWLLILMGNIGGTNLADWVTLEPLENDKMWGLFKPLQLGTEWGSVAVLGSLIIVLIVRYFIVRNRGEHHLLSGIFYWLAILLSSTFGTTSGDFITNDTPFGAFGGSLLLLCLLGIIYRAYRAKRINEFTCYWLALVLMHPVGATIGNWVSKPIGLNLGNVYTNIALVVLFAIVYFKDGRMLSGRQLSPAAETIET